MDQTLVKNIIIFLMADFIPVLTAKIMIPWLQPWTKYLR